MTDHSFFELIIYMYFYWSFNLFYWSKILLPLYICWSHLNIRYFSPRDIIEFKQFLEQSHWHQIIFYSQSNLFSFKDNVWSRFQEWFMYELRSKKRTYFVISNSIPLWRHFMNYYYFRSTLKLHILIQSVKFVKKNSIQR